MRIWSKKVLCFNTRSVCRIMFTVSLPEPPFIRHFKDLYTHSALFALSGQPECFAGINVEVAEGRAVMQTSVDSM